MTFEGWMRLSAFVLLVSSAAYEVADISGNGRWALVVVGASTLLVAGNVLAVDIRRWIDAKEEKFAAERLAEKEKHVS